MGRDGSHDLAVDFRLPPSAMGASDGDLERHRNPDQHPHGSAGGRMSAPNWTGDWSLVPATFGTDWMAAILGVKVPTIWTRCQKRTMTPRPIAWQMCGGRRNG